MVGVILYPGLTVWISFHTVVSLQSCAGYSPESLREEHHPEIYLWAVCSNAPQLYYLRAQPWGGEREQWGALSFSFTFNVLFVTLSI